MMRCRDQVALGESVHLFGRDALGHVAAVVDADAGVEYELKCIQNISP